MRPYLAVMMVMVLIGLSSPVMAGDLVSPQLMAGLQSPSQSQAQPQPQPAPASKQWTRGGKVMTFVGVGLIAAGAFMMTRSNSTISSSCGSGSCSETQISWRWTGAGVAGGGAALVIIGLTRRH